MKRAPLIVTFALAFTATSCGSPEPSSAPPGAAVPSASAVPSVLPGAYAGKNLLLITIDTLRADRLGTYGYRLPTSPAIDALAERGVLFETAFAPRGMTWPSLATVHSGLLPARSGVRVNGQHLPEKIRTLAEVLLDDGYDTSAFVVNACPMTRQGFSTRKCRLRDSDVSANTLRVLAEEESERPWFVWAHYIATHAPYRPAEEFDVFRVEGYGGPITGSRKDLEPLVLAHAELDTTDLAELDGYYIGEVRTVDHEIEKLIDELDARELAEDTVIVLLADHGEDLYEHHGYFFHACSVYDSSLHVPLVLALPDGAGAGRRVPGIVELIDVMPTVAELMGLDIDEALDGRSLLPQIEHDTAEPRRTALGEYYNRESDEAIYTLRTEEWRYVYNPRGVIPRCVPEGDFYRVAREELYDLKRDPGETRNVVDEHPEVVREIRSALRERLAAIPRGEVLEFDESLREELEALGYLN